MPGTRVTLPRRTGLLMLLLTRAGLLRKLPGAGALAFPKDRSRRIGTMPGEGGARKEVGEVGMTFVGYWMACWGGEGVVENRKGEGVAE